MNLKYKVVKTTKTIIIYVLLILCFILYTVCLKGQKLNISNSSYLVIKSGTFVSVPGDLNLGSGVSGILDMKGDSLKVEGQMNLNSGSEFKLSNSVLNINTINYDQNSTVIYQGSNQDVMNHDYGHLAFQGIGVMQITGSTSNPTTCNNFTVYGTGNIVNIPETKAITVNGTFVNNKGNQGFIVESSAAGDGSIIFSTNNISGTVKRYCAGVQWHYISSPINDALASIFPAANFYIWDASIERENLDDISPWLLYSETYLTPGTGYAYYSSGDTISFEGKMNVSDYVQTLYTSITGSSSYQGWNLTGNPFTSAMDWDLAVADGAVPAGAENAIYFFDGTDESGEQGNYHYYVPSTGGTYGIGTEDANKNIPIGQGFFIKTNTDNVSLNLKKSYRIHNSQEYYKSDRNNILKLLVSGNNKSDETILRIVEESTTSFDASYDARKLYTTNEEFPQIYSTDEEKSDFMAINSMPEIIDSVIIPLGFKAKKGSYTFTLKELSINQKSIYFMDKNENIRTNIDEEFLYSFFHEGGIINDRFYIFFGDKSTEINPEIENSNKLKVYPNPTAGRLYISGIEDNTVISITDITGRKLYERVKDKSQEVLDIEDYPAGIYLLRLVNNQKIEIRKIIKK